MNKTYIAKIEDIKREWYLIDAKDKVLGRIATKVAVLLRGKHKAIFTPSVDTGDGV
ncbi:MAG: uL13 family ribosomal protein, partial [Candidatus Omnitrophota bacterium]